jgi:hypothetical protein
MSRKNRNPEANRGGRDRVLIKSKQMTGKAGDYRVNSSSQNPKEEKQIEKIPVAFNCLCFGSNVAFGRLC